MKTRYAKPFESVQVQIPYSTGMKPTSGLVDMFEKMGILTKAGNKLQYVSKSTGEIQAHFRKQWTEDKLMTIMQEWDESALNTPVATEDNVEE
jgi:conjugal transfer/entry exclusion protein